MAVVMVMTARLTSYGHEVVHAKNGLIAVETFLSAAPDLVLMDIQMPVMNGFEATNRIRAVEATQQWAWTPIIFLTASDTEQNLITAIDAGGDDFMAKTVPEPVLQAKMKAMSRIATLRQRLTAANSKLEDMANHDGLTGLYNRRSMDRSVDAAWADAVIWLSALVGDGACALNPDIATEINQGMVEWLAKKFNGRIIFMSTCSVYGAQDLERGFGRELGGRVDRKRVGR